MVSAFVMLPHIALAGVQSQIRSTEHLQEHQHHRSLSSRYAKAPRTRLDKQINAKVKAQNAPHFLRWSMWVR
jgi:hypothetical protein